MHLYTNRKNRVAKDRPQGVNIPCGGRRVIKCISGDTLSFTAMVYVPSTREPVKKADLDENKVQVHVAVAETRFSPVIWAGSAAERWIILDEHRAGLVHITVPRTVMNVLRRGAYCFSVVVDDGIVRETQLTGNFQIEYEPTGSINDIPYRHDAKKGMPISLSPEVDLAAQEHHRLTYDQLVDAVDEISRKLVEGVDKLSSILYGSCDYDPTEAEVDNAVHRLSKLIVWDDTLRGKVPAAAEGRYDPTEDEFVERVCFLLKEGGLKWRPAS
jgi:hypothetical protein